MEERQAHIEKELQLEKKIIENEQQQLEQVRTILVDLPNGMETLRQGAKLAIGLGSRFVELAGVKTHTIIDQ